MQALKDVKNGHSKVTVSGVDPGKFRAGGRTKSLFRDKIDARLTKYRFFYVICHYSVVQS